jgi:hypothetical protein
MIKRINKTEEIKARLNQEHKVSYLDKPAHLDAILKMNDELENVRREYKVKEKNSQTSASNVVLTS